MDPLRLSAQYLAKNGTTYSINVSFFLRTKGMDIVGGKSWTSYSTSKRNKIQNQENLKDSCIYFNAIKDSASWLVHVWLIK